MFLRVRSSLQQNKSVLRARKRVCARCSKSGVIDFFVLVAKKLGNFCLGNSGDFGESGIAGRLHGTMGG